LKQAKKSTTTEMLGTKFLDAGQRKNLFPWRLPVLKENGKKSMGELMKPLEK
jgi:hypothetical protein